MPRFTNLDYLQTREWLAELWATDDGAFGLLPASEQRYLHDYFRPSEDLTSDEALEHRAQVSQEQPSLPQCAGRAVGHLRAELAAIPVVALQPAIGRGKRRVVISAVVRPELDGDALVRALLRAASGSK
jgi:hypothetical protein